MKQQVAELEAYKVHLRKRDISTATLPIPIFFVMVKYWHIRFGFHVLFHFFHRIKAYMICIACLDWRLTALLPSIRCSLCIRISHNSGGYRSSIRDFRLRACKKLRAQFLSMGSFTHLSLYLPSLFKCSKFHLWSMLVPFKLSHGKKIRTKVVKAYAYPI